MKNFENQDDIIPFESGIRRRWQNLNKQFEEAIERWQGLKNLQRDIPVEKEERLRRVSAQMQEVSELISDLIEEMNELENYLEKVEDHKGEDTSE